MIKIKRLLSPLFEINVNRLMPERGRPFVFTINNPLPRDEQRLRDLDTQYLVFGREVAPTTGTPHLQGYAYFANAKSLSSARRLIGGHVECARGLPSQCIAYSKKDGDFYESGVPPIDPRRRGDDEKARWDTAWESAKLGDITNIPADIRIRCYSTIKRIHRDHQPLPDLLAAPCGIWIHGTAGSGKTFSVFAQFPTLYTKGASKWWDGYDGQETVLLDDVDPEQRSWIGRFLKIWSDRYPFVAESKGQSLQIRPKRFIVTSQYTIDQVFLDEETRTALLRRFKVIEKINGQEILLYNLGERKRAVLAPNTRTNLIAQSLFLTQGQLARAVKNSREGTGAPPALPNN